MTNSNLQAPSGVYHSSVKVLLMAALKCSPVILMLQS